MFYPCPYGEHAALADRLCAFVYGVLPYRAEQNLLRRGWLRLNDDGYIVRSVSGRVGETATEAQVGTLDLIRSLAETDAARGVPRAGDYARMLRASIDSLQIAV